MSFTYVTVETLRRQIVESRTLLGEGLRLYQIHSATIESGVLDDARVLEPSAGSALADARAHGLGVIVKEAVANGRLTDRNTSEEASPLKRYADAHRPSSDVVAIAAALSNSWVDVVLSGAVTAEQLTSNLRAVDLAETTGD
jgi:aryl-alcohol dehydrogenase-like predicted oxidoreductase